MNAPILLKEFMKKIKLTKKLFPQCNKLQVSTDFKGTNFPLHKPKSVLQTFECYKSNPLHLINLI